MSITTQANIPIARIKPPSISLRPIRRNTAEYEELVGSIRVDGVLQPILVRPCNPSTGFDYEVVEGWHRLEAAREAGLDSIPCMIRDLSDEQVLIVQIKCNAIRPVTRTFEYARRLMILMQQGYTLPQLSVLIAKNPKWIKDQLQLNRVCEDARPAVERGEIKMQAALALANLPTDLQQKFIDDAIALPTKVFKARAEAANRDFKAFLIQQKQEDREIGATQPAVRAVNVMKRESLKPERAKEVLKATGAKTPLDGWEACLAWVFKLDPVSVEKRRAGIKEAESALSLANNEEWHRMNREMIAKFVNPQSSNGDYRNGK